jgi:hypothetical protein
MRQKVALQVEPINWSTAVIATGWEDAGRYSKHASKDQHPKLLRLNRSLHPGPRVLITSTVERVLLDISCAVAKIRLNEEG